MWWVTAPGDFVSPSPGNHAAFRRDTSELYHMWFCLGWQNKVPACTEYEMHLTDPAIVLYMITFRC